MKELILSVLKREIEKSTGCTDPGSVTLAVSRAAGELGATPEKVAVTVSPNLYKNGVSVGVPGTGRRGLDIAAALGCLIDKSEEGLAVLDYVTPEILAKAEAFLAAGGVTVSYADFPDPLFVHAAVTGGGHEAIVDIAADYSNIIHIEKDGVTLADKDFAKPDESKDLFLTYGLKALYDCILTMELDELHFLLDFAQVNLAAARTGLSDDTLRLGRSLAALDDNSPTESNRISAKARAMTAAAGEARMQGLIVPIMAIAGSGNHGITNFIGVKVVADELGADETTAARALCISSTVTVYIKGYVKRMTAFCGCSIAASAGVAAATVYLLGGSFEQGVLAMQSLIGTLGGMFCDGAKESCALKLSTAAMTAVQFAYLAAEGVGLPAGVGIIGNTIEDTFYNLGQLNNPGMTETDRVIVKLIERSRNQRRGE
ncbi:MAG TPA: L-serine ammonia-lyase, iron-sulfur-dependent, subunit alpha [Candidatus Acidoferrum sp.]|nr:L-serine ammonia-lyase, iron-sulfur-dependent, subunit alpha [Candidatus Acidoferrum sp.]